MPEIRYRTNPNVVATTLDDDESVLLDLNTRRYYSLNETGTRIWEHLVDGAGLTEIAARLTEEYDVSEAEAQEHIEALLSELKSEGLVEELTKK